MQEETCLSSLTSIRRASHATYHEWRTSRILRGQEQWLSTHLWLFWTRITESEVWNCVFLIKYSSVVLMYGTSHPFQASHSQVQILSEADGASNSLRNPQKRWSWRISTKSQMWTSRPSTWQLCGSCGLPAIIAPFQGTGAGKVRGGERWQEGPDCCPALEAALSKNPDVLWFMPVVSTESSCSGNEGHKSTVLGGNPSPRDLFPCQNSGLYFCLHFIALNTGNFSPSLILPSRYTLCSLKLDFIKNISFLLSLGEPGQNNYRVERE